MMAVAAATTSTKDGDGGEGWQRAACQSRRTGPTNRATRRRCGQTKALFVRSPPSASTSSDSLEYAIESFSISPTLGKHS